jgi:hypothetical protein
LLVTKIKILVPPRQFPKISDNLILKEETMNALEKNVAVARGEALAANLLACAAIQAALSFMPNRKEVLAKMSAFIEETLNMSGPGKGDANDEFNTQMREIARFQAMQTLDAITRMLPPQT